VRAVLGATVLATATAGCGAKHDPYAASLAKGSEHVELRGTVAGARVTGSGDFTGSKGTLTVRTAKSVLREVVVGNRIYVDTGRGWQTAKSTGFVTPAQVFAKRMPARVENGLVRSVVLRDSHGTETITFSKYGEQVSVTVPRVKGAAR
jgi:hypothetical protein